MERKRLSSQLLEILLRFAILIDISVRMLGEASVLTGSSPTQCNADLAAMMLICLNTIT